MADYEIGEVKKSNEIGYKGNSYFSWLPCGKCGKERWVMLRKGKPVSIRCHSCARRKPGLGWKRKDGYIHMRISKDDFFASMCQDEGTRKSWRIAQHRLIMAQYLNRCLLPWEIVHHKNGIKDDNRIENLELLPTIRQHMPSRRWQQELAKRDKRIDELLQDIINLKQKVGEN